MSDSIKDTNIVESKASLKIAYLVNFCHQQGTYFRFHHFAKGLTALGHEVKVFAQDHDPRSKSRIEFRDGIVYNIVRNSRGHELFGNPNNLFTSVRRLFTPYERCDVAHLFQPLLSAGLSWMTRMRSLARVRLYDWDDLWTDGLLRPNPTKLNDRWQRFVVSRLEHSVPASADHVTCISHFLYELALNRGARSASVLHNGYVPFEVPSQPQSRAALGLNATAFYIGFMGRTLNELSWLFDSFRVAAARFPTIRLAICGVEKSAIQNAMTGIEDRVDALGQISPEQARTFAATLNLGLVPLMDEPFNRSRFPVKLLDHLGAGVPVLCSDVGEAGTVARTLPGAILAGNTKEDWTAALCQTIARFMAGDVPKVDVDLMRQQWSWETKAAEMIATYRKCLNAS